MKSLVLGLFLTQLLLCCKSRNSSEVSQPSTSEHKEVFEDVFLNNEEVTFIDSHPGGVLSMGDNDEYHVYCSLKFNRNGSVIFESAAYNFSTMHGTYEVEDDLITIYLEKFDLDISEEGVKTPRIFPPLMFKKSPQGIQLQRADAEAHLKEHWNVYDGIDIFPMKKIPSLSTN